MKICNIQSFEETVRTSMGFFIEKFSISNHKFSFSVIIDLESEFWNQDFGTGLVFPGKKLQKLAVKEAAF